MQIRDYFFVLIFILLILSLFERYYKRRGFKNLFEFIKFKLRKEKDIDDPFQKIIDTEFSKEVDFSLPKSVNSLRVLSEYEAEINNGGHDQYFFNSAGNNWQFVKESLEELNSQTELEIFNHALSLFPNSSPQKDRNLRQNQLESINSKLFDKIDKEFYDKANLNDLYRKLISNHPQEFGLKNANKT